MKFSQLFTIDYKLICCVAIAWMIELALGAPGFARKARARLAGTVRKAARRAALKVSVRASALLLIYCIAIVIIATAAVLDLLRKMHPSLYYTVSALLFSLTFTTRSAADEARAVLQNANTRRCSALESEVYRNSIKRLSESCLIGSLAPLTLISAGIFFGLAAPLASAFKTYAFIMYAITDKNSGRGAGCCDGGGLAGIYKAAWKTGRAVCYIPAQICGILLPPLAFICGTGARGFANGLRATREIAVDRLFLQSDTAENRIISFSEIPAAAYAGTLRIDMRTPCERDVRKAILMTLAASIEFIILFCAVFALIFISTR